MSLESLGIDLNVEETGNSYDENAILKLQHLRAKSPIKVIKDDSGIEFFLQDMQGKMQQTSKI